MSPSDPTSISASIFQLASDLESSHFPFVFITLVSCRGHAPQDPGAKALVTRDGLIAGTVGGGKIEAHCILVAQNMIKEKNTIPALEKWNLQQDIGMSCGGEVTMLFEPYCVKEWQIAIFGAGHVAQALAKVLASMPCHVTFVDPRQDWLDRLPKSNNLKAVNPITTLQASSPTELEIKSQHHKLHTTSESKNLVENFDTNTFFICVTQGHAHDVPILEAILNQFPEAPFIGVIGSRVKGLAIRKDLEKLGMTPKLLERIHCPVGLDLGTNHPAEIAISIVAQLIQVRDSLKQPQKA